MFRSNMKNRTTRYFTMYKTTKLRPQIFNIYIYTFATSRCIKKTHKIKSVMQLRLSTIALGFY